MTTKTTKTTKKTSASSTPTTPKLKTKPNVKTAAKPGSKGSANAPTAGEPPVAVKPARKTTTTTAPRLSGLEAAHQVLVESRQPMNMRDLTQAAINKGLWKPAGKTPSATLASAIGREIKTKGKLARFKKTDRGLFAANASKK